MARLYEYADSSDKSGYFIRGGTSESNYTMRATDLGKRLFDRLDYKPGIVGRERGPRVPPEVQWAMYDAGLLTTGENPPSGGGFDGEVNIEDVEFTENQMEELEAFLHDVNTDKDEIQELANILDVELGGASRTPIWELDESARKHLESVYETKISEELVDESDGMEIVVAYESVLSDDDCLIFGVDMISGQEDVEDHYYQMLYYRGRSNGVTAVTRGEVDLEERTIIDRQRSRVLEAMSDVPLQAGLKIGTPGENLEMHTLEGELTKEY